MRKEGEEVAVAVGVSRSCWSVMIYRDPWDYLTQYFYVSDMGGGCMRVVG